MSLLRQNRVNVTPGAASCRKLPHTSPIEYEILESRLLLSAAEPNAVEQYLVALINRARANPTAEASRFGIDLNEGLSPGTISTSPKQPLAINPYITDAATSHSQWMLATDTFDHYEPDPRRTPGDRMALAGYAFVPPAGSGENIAVRGQWPTVPDPLSTTTLIHQDLFVDTNYPQRGHRTNMLDPAFKEVGAGVVSGDYATGGNTYHSVMATEDFGFSAGNSFLTGVVYNDSVTHDGFYTPGEGIGAVNITAVRVSDGQATTVTTWLSGGYSLPLPPGTYSVTASGASLPHPITYSNVIISTQNVLLDFNPEVVPTVGLDANGALTITGTDAADTITLAVNGSNLIVTANDVPSTFSSAAVKSITINAMGSADLVTLDSSITIGASISGGTGKDTLTGGSGNDTINGDQGNDLIHGMNGNDILYGNWGNDTVMGELGNDQLFGGIGDDFVHGGQGADTLTGGLGQDSLIGGRDNDTLFARDTFLDTLDGGPGDNSAQTDPFDALTNIQHLLA